MGRILDELDDILDLVDGGGAPLRSQETYNEITTGVTTMPRSAAVSNVAATLASQSFRLAYFTAVRSFTSTQCVTISGQTAAGATPTLCRVGLYSIAADGAGTLIASIANDTTLWATINTSYTRAWSASAAVTAGTRYAVGVLCVTGATPPVLSGHAFMSTAATGGVEAGRAPRITGSIAAQADLPASFTGASVADYIARFYAVVLP